MSRELTRGAYLLAPSTPQVLSGEADRADAMTTMLKFANLPHRLVEGVDPWTEWFNETVGNSTLASEFDAEWNVYRYHDYFRYTMACTLGHRKM